MAKASGGGIVGLAHTTHVVQKQRLSQRPLGIKKAEARERGKAWEDSGPGVLGRGLEIRPSSLGSSASGENHRSHMWPSGFHLRWEQSFPHHSLLVPVAGAHGRGLGGAGVFRWPAGFSPALGVGGRAVGSFHPPPS